MQVSSRRLENNLGILASLVWLWWQWWALGISRNFKTSNKIQVNPGKDRWCFEAFLLRVGVGVFCASNMQLQIRICVRICVSTVFHFLFHCAKLCILEGHESSPFLTSHLCTLHPYFLARHSIGASAIKVNQKLH